MANARSSDLDVTVAGLDRILKTVGKIYYVDSTNGASTNSGNQPARAFATISQANAVAVAGDTIVVRQGNYDENGLDLSVSGLSLVLEKGVTIVDATTGTQTLLLSGAGCSVHGGVISQASQIGIKVTGASCSLIDTTVSSATIAYDSDGADVCLENTVARGYTTTGYDFSAARPCGRNLVALGSGGATRGFYFSNAAVDSGHFYDLGSAGNATAGYELVSGCDYNIFKDTTTGTNDGPKVDPNVTNTWDPEPNISQSDHHEHVYPVSDGEGSTAALISVKTDAADETNAAASTQWYWGEPVVIIPGSTITDEWRYIGVHLSAVTASKDFHFETWIASVSQDQASKNGGNAWDEGATVLTVDDGTKFAVDDLVWIYSPGYKPNGEIQKVIDVTGNVVTVARETSQFGSAKTGLRWNHTTNDAGNEKMVLIKRASPGRYHALSGDLSFASQKDFARISWHHPRTVRANGALIVRALNRTDGTNAAGFEILAIYEDL